VAGYLQIASALQDSPAHGHRRKGQQQQTAPDDVEKSHRVI